MSEMDDAVVIVEKLKHAWQKVSKADTETSIFEFTENQQSLATPLFKGQNVFYTQSTWKNREEYRLLLCLHLLNELQRQRNQILYNNERLSSSADLEVRDQGFTRPRVLVLLPLRNSALQFINNLISLWEAMDGQVDNKRRLFEEFGPSDEDREADSRRRATNQPKDFIDTFEGNGDDCFRIGIKNTRKALKLFCDFYSSDIIIASPLGLRMVIDGQSETKKIAIPGTKRTKTKKIKKKGDFDFLSSIQLLIVDQADVILMQNWEHLTYCLGFLNRIPKEMHDCDFSRVKSSFLDGQAATTRQNVIFSTFSFPELNSLINSLRNCLGAVKFQTSTHPGIAKKLLKDLKPGMHIVTADSPAELPAARLQYFVDNILCKHRQSSRNVCIFIPSYLDFVQLREYFNTEELSHAILSEYCSGAEISAARTRFFSGQDRFLLVTERFHFFKRYRIRGIRTLIWYGLPEHAEYFEQWMGFLEESKDPLVEMIISPLDYLKVERILGSSRTLKIFSSPSPSA